MSKRTKNIIILIAIIQLFIMIGLAALPAVAQMVPGRYRVALAERNPALSQIAEGVYQRVAPEVTALPAAAATAESAVDIAALLAEPVATTPTAVPPIPPTATPQPAVDVVEEETATAVPTLEPTATPLPTNTPTPVPLPDRLVIENINRIQQTFNNCGPANLTQVLDWYGNKIEPSDISSVVNQFGTPITQEVVAEYLKPNPEDRNVSPWQIADYVNQFVPGYSAIARSGGDIDMIKQFLNAGYPVVIEKGYDLPDTGWWGHYLTVYGYDDTKQEMYSQDSYLKPTNGTGRTDSYADVKKYWQQFNDTFYVVYPTSQEATIHAILGEDLLDDFTMWRDIAAHNDLWVKTNPDDMFAWFNLGTSLARLGSMTGETSYYQAAVQAFDEARVFGLPPRMLWYQHMPYLAYWKVGRYQDVLDLADATLEAQGGRNVEETYWYKGHVLLEMGDISGAKIAYQTALEVNENFYPAQLSLDYIISIGG